MLKEKLADVLTHGIQYEKSGKWYAMSQILDEKEVELFGNYLAESNGYETALYDVIACDSRVEQDFVKDMEARKDVRLYVKLPKWFKVPTPVGEYNPDWAVVMDSPERDGEPVLYLVAESKGSTSKDDLRPNEARKVRCGEKHFRGALGVRYGQVTAASQLPEKATL